MNTIQNAFNLVTYSFAEYESYKLIFDNLHT